ncbi:DNA polymerase I [Clostridia bacterium]|nr:DNA polymerase I [Clostridia bacterium]
MDNKTNEIIAVIDGNSLVYRAYFAIKNPMVTSRGLFTHAVYGFLNMLQKSLADAAPSYIAVAFDRKAPTFRHLEYDAYKAGRAKTPDELSMQIPYLKDVLEAMGITILEMDGFEADDLIGTVAKRAEEAGLRPLIITGDRDELQLVTEQTSVLITKKGVSEFELNTPASMREKYGFGPELFVDYKGLMGDSSDNIPGLPGVGEKTASKLVQTFGSIESILEHLDEVTPDRIRGIIDENRTLAYMSKRLATIVTNAPIDIDLEAMRVKPWNLPRLREIYTELEFKSLLKRLDADAPAGQEAAPPSDAYPWETHIVDSASSIIRTSAVCPVVVRTTVRTDARIHLIDSEAGLSEIPSLLAGAESVVLHTLGSSDHVEYPLVYAIYIYVNIDDQAQQNDNRPEYICVLTRDDDRLLAKTAEILLALPLRLIGCGLQEDLFRLRRARGDGQGRGTQDRGTDPQFCPASPCPGFDAGVANYLLAPGGGEPTFAQICLTYGGITVREAPDFSSNILAYANDEIVDYGLEFCAAAAALEEAMRARLGADGLLPLFDDVEMPLAATLAEIEVNGFTFDTSALKDISAEIDARVDGLTESIHREAGEPFNINSPKQLGEILFDKLGLKGGKKNTKGWSTSADILEKLRFEHPIVGQALEYRTLAKLRGTYIEGLPAYVAKDGKIRAHLQQTIAATGRLSCSDPNLQNIPIRQEFGRLIRKAFTSQGEGYLLLGADYSQIELRVLAHLSGDPALISDFTSGADIHRRTAARVFGVENEEDVTPAQRGGAKAVNFGIIYGMSGFGLSEELSISRKDADRYIAEYFAQHKAVKAYMDACVEEAKENGYTTTILGRRRPIPEIRASQYMVRLLGERLAMNSPVQGSAADIIKVAMNRVRTALREAGLSSKLILQVHDELILEVPEAEAEEAAFVLKQEMENAVTLKVPLVVDVKMGLNWYELK